MRLRHIGCQHKAAGLFTIRKREPLMSLPTAVAITGVAISPAMGRMTNSRLRQLITIMNLRLGVWLPNPLNQKRSARLLPVCGAPTMSSRDVMGCGYPKVAVTLGDSLALRHSDGMGWLQSLAQSRRLAAPRTGLCHRQQVRQGRVKLFGAVMGASAVVAMGALSLALHDEQASGASGGVATGATFI
jgi:hypothetical protein